MYKIKKKMSVQMSVTEILGSVEGLETNKFEQLYRELFALRAQKISCLG